jgi:hypothetical protein
MDFDVDDRFPHGNLAAIRTYEKCISTLVEVLSNAGVDFKPHGSGQRARFESVRRELASRLSQEDKREGIWKAAAEFGIERAALAGDDETTFIVSGANAIAENPKAAVLDDLSPNEIKAAMYQVVETQCPDRQVILTGREFFRQALNLIQKEGRTVTRINVVSTNFWRLLQYLEEVTEEDERVRLHGVGRYIDTVKVRITC